MGDQGEDHTRCFSYSSSLPPARFHPDEIFCYGFSGFGPAELSGLRIGRVHNIVPEETP